MSKKTFPLALAELSSAWRNKLDMRLKPLGLSQAKWRILFYLSIEKTPPNQVALARRLSIEGPTLVGLLDRLSQDGWLTRTHNIDDRRTKTIELTPKAKSTIVKIHRIANKLREELLNAISIKELSICEKVLQQIKRNIETIA